MPRFLAPFLLVVSALLPGLGRAAELAWSEAESAITLQGAIVNGDDARFAALLVHRPRNLIIRSGGGTQLPAIAIAHALKAHEMTVIVDGFCASACAQIIFPAAAERRIRPESFVAFHGGNLAAIAAVRAEIAREVALLDASAGSVTDEARRAAVEQFFASSGEKIDGLTGEQQAFDTEMRLDPSVTEFYQRLTAPRGIRVVLKPGDPQPVRVAIGRPGVCDWWIPDRDGLARLGLTLRNGYDVPSPQAVAAVTRGAASRLYFGPPLAPDDPRLETLCPPP